VMVRGGRPGDTRTYIDGQLVPLLFHFGGLTAVVNSDFLESLDFYPGNLPLRYGRSIAGAVDVNTREGRRDRWHGYANVNLTEATLFAEGPVGESGSLVGSLRRSYIDAVLPVVFDLAGWKDAVAFSVAPRYWDYQLKGDVRGERDSVSLFLFGSDDRLAAMLPGGQAAAGSVEQIGTASMSITFHRLTGLWKHRFASGLENRLTATAAIDQSAMSMGAGIAVEGDVRSLSLREELSREETAWFKWQAGLDVIGAWFGYSVVGPPMPQPGEFLNPLVSDQSLRAVEDGWAAQPAAFVEATVKPIPALRLLPGVRVDGDTHLGRVWADPRVTALYELAGGNVVLKAAAGLHHQPPTPEKQIKIFGNSHLREEGSRQYAAGVEWKFAELFGLDLQFYYKDMYEEAVMVAGTVATSDGVARQNFANKGLGRAYGAELLLRRDPGGGLFGWVAASVGQTERRQSASAPWVPSYLDQRYNLLGVVSYKLPRDFEIGARVRVTDGNPKTPLAGSVYDSDGDLYLPLPSSATRSQRRPTFFQLDVRVDKRWTFEKWILDAYLDVQNVTNRYNEEGDNTNYDFTKSQPLVGLPIFPSFGLRGDY